MLYHYLAFGIPIVSEVQLPALVPAFENSEPTNPVYVKLGSTPTELSGEVSNPDGNTLCSINEMIYTIPEKIRFYIANGSKITIEPINGDYAANLIYFYSNCLAAILYQRDLIPFHVSGVFTGTEKITLFAAPSGTGKSTLAVKLRELGYKIFTDDTAVLFIRDGKCYAQASYPMIRLWENSFQQQYLLQEADKKTLYPDDELDKYGFSFHDFFATKPVEVERIIFLEKGGDDFSIKAINGSKIFGQLADNVYRCHWIPALKKNLLQFQLISQILGTVPCFLAKRPGEVNSIDSFPLEIKKYLQAQ